MNEPDNIQEAVQANDREERNNEAQKSEPENDEHEPIGIIFHSWEDALEEYYKYNTAESDDSDKEEGRIMVWIEDNNHKIIEEEHTLKEWLEIELQAKQQTNEKD